MIELILLFTVIYYLLVYFNFFGIYGSPGSNQINLNHLFKYYYSLYTEPQNISLQKIDSNLKKGYSTIFGYCCRQLFNTFIQNIKNDIKYKNKNINIGVSPIHHTSFRDIIEKNFPKENIHIFDIDEEYEKIIIPDNKKNIDYDIIVITHLWGKYLNIDDIKENIKNAIIVEDVVLAGKFEKEFINNSDLLFHSCGMDKRPSSIFGGYVHIKNKHNCIIENMKQSINILEIPTNKDILKKLYDTTLLYLLYNLRPIQNITKLILNLSGNELSDITQQIRKNKPGFEHTNYMKRPTDLMININNSIYNTQKDTEELFIKKNKLFICQFSNNQIIKYFPWNSKNENLDSCLPYNIIYIEEIYHEKVIEYFDYINTCIIRNPTYKTFAHSDKEIKKMLNNIIYLPCLYNLNNNEIIELSIFLKKILYTIE